MFSFWRAERTIKMKKVRFDNGLQGKGFAAALVLSICAVGISTYAAYSGAVVRVNTEDEKKKQEENIFVFTQENEPVNAERYDIPKETELIIGESTETEAAEAVVTGEEEAGLFFKKPKTMPIANAEIINPYSNGELVKSETLGVWKTHDGIDIAAEEGTAVASMMKGTVTEVKKDPLWGICVIIDHGDGVLGHYYNLAENVAVKSGQEVKMGEIIGQVGNTADIECKEQPHLHFGVTVGGAWTDPQKYIES